MKTLKIRIKDSNQTKLLCQLASEVNLVWNYCNELGFKYLQRTGKFLSAYDIDKYTAGASKECGLHSQTIQAISSEAVTRRKQCQKAPLKWRVSNPKSAKRSLGWIPFKKSAIKYGKGLSNMAKISLSYGIATTYHNLIYIQVHLSKTVEVVGMYVSLLIRPNSCPIKLQKPLALI